MSQLNGDPNAGASSSDPVWSTDGRPPPPPISPGQRPTGKEVVAASWGLLKQDKSLLWLPALSTITGLVAAAFLFVPGYFVGHAINGSEQLGGYIGGALSAYAFAVAAIYFNAALVIGAFMRAEGGDPTVGEVLRRTWSMKGRVLSWALVTTTVGLAIRALEQRLGVLGAILGFLGGVAWAIATFFAVPVLVAEGVGPIEALKRSAHIIGATWGPSIRTTLRIGFGYLLLLVAPVAVIVAGIALTGASPALGILLIVIGAAGLAVLLTLFSAVTTYARAMIYRYATGRPVPGIRPELLAGAFVAKRRRGFAGA